MIATAVQPRTLFDLTTEDLIVTQHGNVISIERLEDDIFASCSEVEREMDSINCMISNLCSFIDLTSSDNQNAIYSNSQSDLIVA